MFFIIYTWYIKSAKYTAISTNVSYYKEYHLYYKIMGQESLINFDWGDILYVDHAAYTVHTRNCAHGLGFRIDMCYYGHLTASLKFTSLVLGHKNSVHDNTMLLCFVAYWSHW